jgi:Glycosyl transferase family 2
MLDFSIVIPHLSTDQALETTLVSVLQNRPNASEVIVVDDGRYTDPYELGDEVRFIRLDGKISHGRCLRAVLKLARGQIVHWLSSGCEVIDGWCQQTRSHFEDETVGSVCPLMTSTVDTQLHVGVGISRHFRRVELSIREMSDREIPSQLLAPSMHAGFYRRDAVARLPLIEKMHDATLDVELGIALKNHGYQTVVDHQCLIQESDAEAQHSHFEIGQAEQGLINRYSSWYQPGSKFQSSLLSAMGDFAGCLIEPSRMMALAGRWSVLRSSADAEAFASAYKTATDHASCQSTRGQAPATVPVRTTRTRPTQTTEDPVRRRAA